MAISRIRASLGLLCVLFILGPSGSWAQGEDSDEDDTTRSGAYVGLAISGGIPAFDGGQMFTIDTNTSADVNEEPSVGLNARVGWRFLPWLATELQYEWMNEFNVETRSQECAKAKAQVLTGNIKLLAPYHAFHPYALAGVGAGRYESETRTIPLPGGLSCSPNPGKHSSQRDWELAARFGLGFDIYLNDHFVINMETTGVYSDERPFGHSWPFVSIAAGLQYRF